MASPISHDPSFWAAVETLKRSQETKLCLGASSADPCQGGIISAHTIPRSQLQHIAVNGHVYTLSGNLPIFQKTEGRLEVAKKGIGNFSVLNCFCGHHDVSLFLPIEIRPLTFTPEQITILHYRAIAAEVYRKMTAITGFEEALASLLKNPTVKNTSERKRLARDTVRGMKLGIVDVGRTFKFCEEALFEKRYGEISALVINFRKAPSLMSVGGFSPDYDFDGKRLQNLGNEACLCDQISLSIVASDGKAAAVMAWLKAAPSPKLFAESLIHQRSEHYTTLMIQTAFERLENTCMNIPWWDALRTVERKLLTERMEIAANPTRRRLSSAHTYCGVTFDDWGYENHRYINV
jgi:hypothetical protein